MTAIGPRTKWALEQTLPGKKRHKLLVAIAQALDAGEEPSARELLERCPEIAGYENDPHRSEYRHLDGLRSCLEQEGWLETERCRYRYSIPKAPQ